MARSKTLFNESYFKSLTLYPIYIFSVNKTLSNRLSNFEDYLYIVKCLINKGFTVVKMGKGCKQINEFNRPNFIDYAGKFYNDYSDIWLCSNCLFFINISSGDLSTLAIVFRKPLLCLNYDVFTFWSTHINVLTSFKKIIKNDKIINLS